MKRARTALLVLVVGTPGLALAAQGQTAGVPQEQDKAQARRPTPEELNKKLQELTGVSVGQSQTSLLDYRIGPNDLLGITVFDVPELSLPVRVSASGEISLPLLGLVRCEGMTPRELELVLAELLRRSYMKNPHVTVQVTEVESHPVSVVGAVTKPGVFQIRGPRPLLELLSMAGGLAPEAGESVLITAGPEDPARGGGGAAPAPAGESANGSPRPGTLEIDLRLLLESHDPRYNVLIYPGWTVRVKQAGMVYVVGEVKRPGGFALQKSGTLTVLQALAMGEGLTPNAAKGSSLVIRTEENGERVKIPVDLGKMLRGKTPDLALRDQDIVFVPNSRGKALARGTVDAILRVITVRAVVF